MAYLFTNNASALLTVGISTADTVIQLEAGKGVLFPQPSAGDVFRATLFDASGEFEIVECTARTNENLTVVRAREGTLARAWDTTARLEHRLTATQLGAFLQKTGGTMLGDLNMGGKLLTGAVFPSIQSFDIVRANKLQSAADPQTVNQLIFPTGGGLLRMGGGTGSVLITRSELRRLIFMFSGAESSIAAPFVICNGANNTPDLRDRFIIASGQFHDAMTRSPSTVSSARQKTFAGGAISNWRTANTTLTIAQIPAHHHVAPDGALVDSGQDLGYAGFQSQISTGSQTTTDTGGDQPHDHAMPQIAAHDHELPEPVWFCLAFVMYNPNLL